MNPMLQQFLITIFRAGLLWLSGWFVSKGIVSGEEMEKYIAAAAVGLVTLAWALWSRYKSRITFLTALSAPEGTTEKEVKEMVKDAANKTDAANTLPSILLPVLTVWLFVGCASDVANIRRAEYGAVNVSAAALRGHAVYFKAATNNPAAFNRTLDGLVFEREQVKAAAVKVSANAELLEALLSSYETNKTVQPNVQSALSALLLNSSAIVSAITNQLNVKP